MALWFGCVLWITVFRAGFWPPNWFGGEINLRPLQMYQELLSYGNWSFICYNLFGNILIFAPLGYLMRGNGDTLSRTALVGLFFTFVVEGLQFVFATGLSDIDDLVLNTAGAVSGWLFHFLLWYDPDED